MTEPEKPPLRARRWAPPSGPNQRPSAYRPYRLAVRLVAIPALAVAGVFIYNGLRERFVLPECDSGNAKQTLGEILKQLKLEPVRYDGIKTVSISKQEVVCDAELPLPDGSSVAVDYSFYWQGDKANMKYSVAHKAGVSPPSR